MLKAENITDCEIEARELHRLCTMFCKNMSESGTVDDCADFLMRQGFGFAKIQAFFNASELFTTQDEETMFKPIEETI